MRRHPYREAYKHPSWQQVRRERYGLVGGRCEDCGAELKGELFPRGVAWECDHYREPQLFENPVDANVIENARCRCVPCHKKKTQSSRRARR